MAEDANEYGNTLNTDSEDELDIIGDKLVGGGNDFEACKSESDLVESVLYTPPPVRLESNWTHWTLIGFQAVRAQSELSLIRIRAQSNQSPSLVQAQSEYKIINTRAGFEPMTS